MAESSYNSYAIRRKIQIIDVIIALILLGFAILSLLNYNEIKSGVITGVETYGFIGLFLVIFFLEVVPNFLNPVMATWTATASGLNIYSILIVSVIASIIGSCMGFWIGKKYGFKYVILILEEKTITKIMSFWKKWGNLFVVVAAITPVPYVPLVFGSLKMSWRNFIIFGIIFRIINFIALGYLFYWGFWSL